MAKIESDKKISSRIEKHVPIEMKEFTDVVVPMRWFQNGASEDCSFCEDFVLICTIFFVMCRTVSLLTLSGTRIC